MPTKLGSQPISLQTEDVDISSIQPYPDNPRVHSAINIGAIQASLREFGQTRPLVVWHDLVIAGCGTLEAIRGLGWKTASIVRADHLSEPQAKAYLIADNKTTDLSEFDYQRLAELIREIDSGGIDLSATGMQSYELEPLLQEEWTPEPEGEDPVHMNNLRFTDDELKSIRDAMGVYGQDGETQTAFILRIIQEACNAR